MPKVTQSVCMEPTHKPKESDPSIGSLNNYCEMAGADQCCLVGIFCNALLPFLFLTSSSAPASKRGCLQRGEWAGRVETRSLEGPPLGTDRIRHQNQLCLLPTPPSIWSMGCSGEWGRGAETVDGRRQAKDLSPATPRSGTGVPRSHTGQAQALGCSSGGSRGPGRFSLSPPLSPLSA